MEAKPQGTLGYRLRSRKVSKRERVQGEHERGIWREGGGEEKSFIKSNTVWNVPVVMRRADCGNVGSWAEKVNLYLFLPTGAMLMSNAWDVWACARMQTHNIPAKMTSSERKIKGLIPVRILWNYGSTKTAQTYSIVGYKAIMCIRNKNAMQREVNVFSYHICFC